MDGVRTTQLFDLDEDPAETADLSRDPLCAADLERLRHMLQGWRRDCDDTQEQGSKFWEGFDSD